MAVCTRSDCTVAETGICLLNNDPEICEHRVGSVHSATDLLAPVLPTPRRSSNLRASLALGTDEIGEVFNRASCIMVGILGLPGAGKTGALVSMYLQLANRQLKGFEYRHSATLSTFEQLSRGLRDWNPSMVAQQLTAHTEIADERTPAFLHLRAHHEGQNRLIDLLLPDLPGEWTFDLAQLNRTERFSFLGSCQQIWLFVDGRKLTRLETRNTSLRGIAVTIRRVIAMLGDNKMPIRIVTTWADAAVVEDAWFDEIFLQAARDGWSVSAIKIASFSDSAEVVPGTGIDALVESLLATSPDIAAHTEPAPKTGRRSVMNYRG